MRFENQKKIQATKAYFQISTGIHDKYGKSLAITIIPKQTVDGKPRPDYDNYKCVLCSFNQASKIANKLFLAAELCLIGGSDEITSKFFEYKVGKTKIEFGIDEQKKQVILIFENGDSVEVIFDLDVAFVCCDLIKSRLNEFELEEDKSDSNNTGQQEEQPTEEDIENEVTKKIFEALTKTPYFNDDGVQAYLEEQRKKQPKKKSSEILKELADKFPDVKY